ncbi:hypothetical protein D3C80_852670 [compost metagenome]
MGRILHVAQGLVQAVGELVGVAGAEQGGLVALHEGEQGLGVAAVSLGQGTPLSTVVGHEQDGQQAGVTRPHLPVLEGIGGIRLSVSIGDTGDEGFETRQVIGLIMEIGHQGEALPDRAARVRIGDEQGRVVQQSIEADPDRVAHRERWLRVEIAGDGVVIAGAQIEHQIGEATAAALIVGGARLQPSGHRQQVGGVIDAGAVVRRQREEAIGTRHLGQTLQVVGQRSTGFVEEAGRIATIAPLGHQALGLDLGLGLGAPVGLSIAPDVGILRQLEGGGRRQQAMQPRRRQGSEGLAVLGAGQICRHHGGRGQGDGGLGGGQGGGPASQQQTRQGF